MNFNYPPCTGSITGSASGSNQHLYDDECHRQNHYPDQLFKQQALHDHHQQLSCHGFQQFDCNGSGSGNPSSKNLGRTLDAVMQILDSAEKILTGNGLGGPSSVVDDQNVHDYCGEHDQLPFYSTTVVARQRQHQQQRHQYDHFQFQQHHYSQQFPSWNNDGSSCIGKRSLYSNQKMMVLMDDLLEPTPIGPCGVQNVTIPVSTMNMDSGDMCNMNGCVPADVVDSRNNRMHNLNPGGASSAFLTRQQQLVDEQPSSAFDTSGIDISCWDDDLEPLPAESCMAVTSSSASSSSSSTEAMTPARPEDGLQPKASTSSSSSVKSAAAGPRKSNPQKYQTSQWDERFQELLQFKEEHGHMFVPHSYPPNQKLAQWVKRQRYQFRLKCLGKHSTLSDDREQTLSRAGFIYDSHKAAWQEKFQELQQFAMIHGHCNVPATYNNDASLSVWCKHQRRQFKIMKRQMMKCRGGMTPTMSSTSLSSVTSLSKQEETSSTITPERIEALDSIGFDWNPRNLKN